MMFSQQVHCTRAKLKSKKNVAFPIFLFFSSRFLCIAQFFSSLVVHSKSPLKSTRSLHISLNQTYTTCISICVTCYRLPAHFKLMIIMKETSKTLFITILKWQHGNELEIHFHEMNECFVAVASDASNHLSCLDSLRWHKMMHLIDIDDDSNIYLFTHHSFCLLKFSFVFILMCV